VFGWGAVAPAGSGGSAAASGRSHTEICRGAAWFSVRGGSVRVASRICEWMLCVCVAHVQDWLCSGLASACVLACSRACLLARLHACLLACWSSGLEPGTAK
jgi:hypothetical protein